MCRFLSNTKLHLDAQWSTRFLFTATIDLVPVLSRLESDDWRFLRDLYIKSPWAEGSQNVLMALQRARILTMSDYIYYKCTRQQELFGFDSSPTTTTTDEDEIQLQMNMEKNNAGTIKHIMNDLLDGNYELLADVVLHISNTDHKKSLKLTELLDSAVQRIVQDLHTHLELVHKDYFGRLTKCVPTEQLDAFRAVHVKHMLNLESHTTADVISAMFGWSTDVSWVHPALLALMRSSVERTSSEVCNRLLALAQTPSFTGWRWWMRLWRHALSGATTEVFAIIRQELKEMFKRFHRTGNERFFHVMLICSRHTADCGGEEFGTYDTWFRRTFGEMGHVQTADEFRLTLETLTKMIELERDVDGVLQAHLDTRFLTPPHCHGLVRDFKDLTRSWVAELSKND